MMTSHQILIGIEIFIYPMKISPTDLKITNQVDQMLSSLVIIYFYILCWVFKTKQEVEYPNQPNLYKI